MKIKVWTTCSCGCGERVFARAKIGTFSFSWSMDAGEWFMYLRTKNKFWRFSSAGYLSWKDMKVDWK